MNFLLAIVVSILSYGAVPNDTTVNNAKAINTAISDCEIGRASCRERV